MINDSSPLFGLRHLQHLNLGYGTFFGQVLPTKFSSFANLTYLNLSHSGFIEQIPIGISNLTSLVILDLSCDYYSDDILFLEELDLKMFVQNLTSLTELYLDGVRISSKGNDWSRTVSSFLPNLRVLSLSGCQLSSPIDSSLQNLQFLSVINLANNNLSSPFPEFLVEFSNLSSLVLSKSNLHGIVPENIFQKPSLKIIDFSYNDQLHGSLPEFYVNEIFQKIDLSRTSFSGMIPRSIGNLHSLKYLNLAYNNFIGFIPSSTAELKELVYLDLSFNNFSGPIPSLSSLKSLKEMYLNGNKLNGSISSTNWEGLSDLTKLDLSYNSFSGEIPWSLFGISRLSSVTLSNNQFTGLPNDFANLSRSQLYSLDLSYNQIGGVLPSWIWEMKDLNYLNVSHNVLVEVGKPSKGVVSQLETLDLHANRIQGQIQFLPPYAENVDYSSNNFSYIVPSALFSFLNPARFLFLSNNNLQGSIPQSICNDLLTILDLSNNSLNGMIPKCLFKSSPSLTSVKLSSNKLTGPIPDNFARYCNLEYLDLSGNLLEGNISRSMANCQWLKFLNLGKNQLSDVFPAHLMNILTLEVLGLHSNKLYGSMVCREKKGDWPNLHIINIASNNFSGELPKYCFQSWIVLMVAENKISHPLGFSSSQFDPNDTAPTSHFDFGWNIYETYVTTTKGQERELSKIFSEYKSIDFSCNNFEGLIPNVIGDLKGLRMLNLSHNALYGEIPRSIGRMKNLESMDLSRNNLSGAIPSELASLSFLEYGVFSYNHLVGRIPTSTQLQSFPSSFFEGNAGLCGAPLATKCSKQNPPTREHDDHTNSTGGVQWSFISIELGFTFGLGVVVLPITFSRRWRVFFYRHVERVLFKILPRLPPRNYMSRKSQVGNLQNLRRQ